MGVFPYPKADRSARKRTWQGSNIVYLVGLVFAGRIGKQRETSRAYGKGERGLLSVGIPVWYNILA